MKPFEKRDDESWRDYSLFKLYCNLGNSRTLDQLAEHPDCTVSYSTVSKLSTKYDWHQRAKSFDYDVKLDASSVDVDLEVLKLQQMFFNALPDIFEGAVGAAKKGRLKGLQHLAEMIPKWKSLTAQENMSAEQIKKEITNLLGRDVFEEKEEEVQMVFEESSE